MKFKIIFILFNIVVLFSLFMIVFMPVLMLGTEYSSVFFSTMWYVILLFAAVIGAVDTYFIVNWKLFKFLEEEKWEELIEYLERKISKDKLPGGFTLRILINAYLSKSDLDSIEKLGAKIKDKKPALYKKMILLFAVPILLKSDPVLIEEFSSPYVEDKSVKDRIWLEYLLSFAYLLQEKTAAAAELLSSLCREKASPVLKLLVLYSFKPYADSEEDTRCIAGQKARLLKKYNRKNLELQIERERSNVVVAVLSGMVSEAVDWLYSQDGKIQIEE